MFPTLSLGFILLNKTPTGVAKSLDTIHDFLVKKEPIFTLVSS